MASCPLFSDCPQHPAFMLTSQLGQAPYSNLPALGPAPGSRAFSSPSKVPHFSAHGPDDLWGNALVHTGTQYSSQERC